MDHDAFVEALMTNISEDWGAGEGSAESIVIDYVRALEKRLEVLGGNLAPHDGGQTAALGTFYSVARLHVLSDSVDDWNGLVDAWNAYVRIKAEAE